MLLGLSLVVAAASVAPPWSFEPAAAGPSSPAAQAAAAIFTVTPEHGPLGTEIQLASSTPCAPPTAAGEMVVVQPSQFPALSDAVPVYPSVSFPVRPDGSWSGSLPARFSESGPAELNASCATDGGPPVIYTPQTFRQTPSSRGYWMATTVEIPIPCFCPPGGPGTNVAAFGDARYLGSPAEISTAIPLVGMAATPIEGLGYWLAAADGGVFSYGDAPFLGSAAGAPLNKAVVGMAASPTGLGYRLVASESSPTATPHSSGPSPAPA